MLLRKSIVTLDIFYYIPKHTIIQEFVWQTEDISPEYKRIHKFLQYWQKNIDAAVQEILMCDSFDNKWRSVNFDLKLQ